MKKCLAICCVWIGMGIAVYGTAYWTGDGMAALVVLIVGGIAGIIATMILADSDL